MKYPISKYRTYSFTDDKTGLRTIKAISTYAGKRVVGKAVCHPEDAYSEDNGIKLAVLRCAKKIAGKRVKRATKCVAEAERQMKEAQRYYFKMAKYLNDAKQDYDNATAELEDFESKI